MISIELTKRFRRIVRASGREDEVAATLQRIQDGFGRPHLHSGLSIRKLGRQIYECRTAMDWRLLFMAQKGLLTFDFAGDHDEVRDYLHGRQ